MESQRAVVERMLKNILTAVQRGDFGIEGIDADELEDSLMDVVNEVRDPDEEDGDTG